MVRKFYLVPSDQFQHMLTTSVSSPEAGDKPLRKILRNKKLKQHERKALYDQELTRYLHRQKEKAEKPTRVEIVKKGGNNVKATMIGSKLVHPSEESETQQQEVSVPVFETPSIETTTPTAPPAPSRRIAARDAKKSAEDVKIAEFKRRIWANRTPLGISESGRVLNAQSNRPVTGSNYDSILNYLLAADTSNMQEPKGTQQLMSKIRRDPHLHEEYKAIVAQRRGLPLQPKFSPALWS